MLLPTVHRRLSGRLDASKGSVYPAPHSSDGLRRELLGLLCAGAVAEAVATPTNGVQPTLYSSPGWPRPEPSFPLPICARLCRTFGRVMNPCLRNQAPWPSCEREHTSIFCLLTRSSHACATLLRQASACGPYLPVSRSSNQPFPMTRPSSNFLCVEAIGSRREVCSAIRWLCGRAPPLLVDNGIA
jgi:hypothetical protein